MFCHLQQAFPLPTYMSVPFLTASLLKVPTCIIVQVNGTSQINQITPDYCAGLCWVFRCCNQLPGWTSSNQFTGEVTRGHPTQPLQNFFTSSTVVPPHWPHTTQGQYILFLATDSSWSLINPADQSAPPCWCCLRWVWLTHFLHEHVTCHRPGRYFSCASLTTPGRGNTSLIITWIIQTDKSKKERKKERKNLSHQRYDCLTGRERPRRITPKVATAVRNGDVRGTSASTTFTFSPN